ncbi:APC family permease [Rhodanobacter sp. KK11]|jgi:amino acid transporter|uniref:APC family permease n=1 Tax=Rhodanobacter sp. KK11 TaxID=3083255 RepID=UPI00296691CE|nr:APC family permease [Rhodanobacter sp. KK11]MDW2981262.1 APC family permease [Rhodanobacter sp. KK11]
MQATTTTRPTRGSSFHRSIGLFTGTAINMTQMCGIGPFITIPIMVATMGGPQAVIGWIVGALLAVADGMVWAELGAAMPGSGGTYVYLREAFQYRTGKLMPFLFIWTVLLTIPLLMSTGIIGMVEYLGFFFPHLGWWPVHLISLLATALVTLLLYRRIESIRVITIALWVIMLLSVVGVSAAGFADFHPEFAFSYPDGMFGGQFFVGLGAGLIIGIYDYLGYFTTAYMGDELRNPGRTMPGSIIISVIAMMFVYLILNISVLGVAPWQEIAQSKSIASLVVEHSWGHSAAAVMTILIIVTAFASVFAGLLGGSRVPFQAAHDKVFLSVFGKLHAKHGFPHVALLTMGVITAIGTFFDLAEVINMLLAATIIVQFIAQIAALVVLRKRQPQLPRPYRQWLYPVPCVIALVGWIYVYLSASTLSLILSGIWIVAGLAVFALWARVNRSWPFAPVEIREAYLEKD